MRKIIMDVDTGTDDATAIMMASLCKELDIVAICTGWGCRDLETTTRHTLMIRELMGESMPVYKGSPSPMVRDIYPPCPPVFQSAKVGIDENGKSFSYHDDFELPLPKTRVEDKNAVAFYLDFLKTTQEKITIVATGALTNIGYALKIDPSIAKNIDEIVIMGGGISEFNISTCAEANVFRDPEAAQIVTYCGAKITYLPLDATHRAALPKEYIEKCEKLHTPAGEFFAKMLRSRIKAYNNLQPLWRSDIAPIHDAVCVAYLIDPLVLKDVRYVHLDISLDMGKSAGAFLIDTRHFHAPENCYIAYDADVNRFGKVVMDLLNSEAEIR